MYSVMDDVPRGCIQSHGRYVGLARFIRFSKSARRQSGKGHPPCNPAPRRHRLDIELRSRKSELAIHERGQRLPDLYVERAPAPNSFNRDAPLLVLLRKRVHRDGILRVESRKPGVVRKRQNAANYCSGCGAGRSRRGRA